MHYSGSLNSMNELSPSECGHVHCVIMSASSNYVSDHFMLLIENAGELAEMMNDTEQKSIVRFEPVKLHVDGQNCRVLTLYMHCRIVHANI